MKHIDAKHFKQYERVGSWLVFLFATIVYFLTMEKSASLWDNPEFITTFHKLEVGHPPGAPFYMLVYNFFSHLFPQHGQWVAIAANALSCIFSGLTVMLLFRTIVYLVRRGDMARHGADAWARSKEQSIPLDKAIAYLGALCWVLFFSPLPIPFGIVLWRRRSTLSPPSLLHWYSF